MESHQENFQIFWIFSRTSTCIDEKRDKMFLSGMHYLRIFQFFPCLNSIQQLFLAFITKKHVCELSVKNFTYLNRLRLTKTSMAWCTRANNEKTLLLQSSESNTHTKMSFRIEWFSYRNLNDGNISLWVHDHHGNKNSMIIPAFRVCP